ncbi:hypothetical protein [Metallibacterium scheffleri]|nr:hypothetical protein [Metallibacterium scheffleri]
MFIQSIEHRHLLVAVNSQRAQREILEFIPGWIPDLRNGYQGRACFLFTEQENVFAGQRTGRKFVTLAAVGNDGDIRAYYSRALDRVRQGRIATANLQPFSTPEYESVIERVLHNAAPLGDYVDAEISFNVITKSERLIDDPKRRVLLYTARRAGIIAEAPSGTLEESRFGFMLSLYAHATAHILADVFGGEWGNVYGIEPYFPGKPGAGWFLDAVEPSFGWQSEAKHQEALA